MSTQTFRVYAPETATVRRVALSDPMDWDQCQGWINAWFALSDEHPEILVQYWQIVNMEYSGVFGVAIELLVPETWIDTYETLVERREWTDNIPTSKDEEIHETNP